MSMGFEWDQGKAEANLKKHGIGFDEAATVFADPFSVTISDPDHSLKEARFIDIGTSNKGRVLVVSYTERQGRIRIISCRKATAYERRTYEECNRR